jgi:predicted esterase
MRKHHGTRPDGSRLLSRVFLERSTNNTVDAVESNVNDIPVYNFSHVVLNDPRKPLGSVLLLNPLGGYAGWWREWLADDFKKLLEKRWRVLEVIPRRNADYVYPAWYSYEDSDDWFKEIPIETELTEAVNYIHSLIRQEHDLGTPFSRIAMVGYSQGATLALESGLRFPSKLGLVFSERGVVLASRLGDSKGLSQSRYIMTAGQVDNKYEDKWVKKGWNFLCGKQVPSFYRQIAGLNHAKASKQETMLALESVSIVLESSDSPSNSIRSSLEAKLKWTASCTKP